MSTEKFSDPQVVAAFNSCLDLAKWNALPRKVRARFECLMKHHRVKFVCFSGELGLGLRVFTDQAYLPLVPNFGNQHFADTDEVYVLSDAKAAEDLNSVDLEGHWLRCPPALYTERTVPDGPWLVMNDKGTKYVGRSFDFDPSNAAEEVGNTDVTPSDDPDADWRGVRTSAYKFGSREAADKAAKVFKGVVVLGE